MPNIIEVLHIWFLFTQPLGNGTVAVCNDSFDVDTIVLQMFDTPFQALWLHPIA